MKSNSTLLNPRGVDMKKAGNLIKSRPGHSLKKARDGIRTLPMSGKLLKSRRNAHCLTCVYRLSTTKEPERKAVKGSAEQIHLAPLLLVIKVDNVPELQWRLIEQFLSINLLVILSLEYTTRCRYNYI